MYSVRLILTLVATALAGGAVGSARTVYVSPTGADSASGTRAEPLATLEQARDLLRAEGAGGDKVIEVLPGTHYLASPLELGPQDSGLTITGSNGVRPIISGGKVITDWSRADGKLWKAPVPQASLHTQMMRAGNEAQILARTPDFDANDPIKGGWKFVAKPPPTGLGEFGQVVGGLHTKGDWLEWEIQVPTEGTYALWMRYSAENSQYLDAEGMRNRMQVQVSGRPPMALENVPDTGSWEDLRWHRTGELELPAGKHVLRWTNLKGGGLGLDALALAADEDWSPEGADWKALPDNAILVQGEAFTAQAVKELTAPKLKYGGQASHFSFHPGDIRQYPLSPHPRLHMFPAWGWVNTIVDLESVDHQASVARVKPTRSASEEIWPGNRYFVANIREGLDSPGEWWIDQGAGQILWWPRREEDLRAPVVLATLDRLLVIKEAADIQIRNLEFRDTSYSLEVGVYAPDDAAVHLLNAHRCVIEGNRFTQLGGYAAVLADRASGNEFVGNEVAWCGQGGVFLRAWEPGAQPVENLVAGNHFHHLGTVYKHVAAVYCTAAHRTRIIHNLMEDLPRYGISFKGYSPGVGSHGNVAEYNVILRTNLETNDSGAIELYGRDKEDSGNIIQYNRIEDVVGFKTDEDGQMLSPYMTWGIYLDDYASGTTVRGNFLARHVLGGVAIHGGRNNLVEGNLIVDGREHQIWSFPIDDFSVGNRVLRNVFAWTSPTAVFFKHENSQSPQTPRQVFTEFDYNLLWKSPPADLTAQADLTPLGNWGAWREAGFDQHSVVAAPQFRDPAAGDYRISPDSPAAKLGIQDLPWAKMGLGGYERSWKP